ncbi:50S ribosomal protein L25/general stress protein Ctc [Paenibacillus sp. IB182496]|uniref:Large ribosomal subunit protein bL25 n=1 Tax=Paenibacillus sabuli TaxID=2772509 RepID=A0A927GU54_9BACL|nr:50S ribosomal protein L25/general stress protein Ctc [Paenibacillus sabuli]MBD2848313.1 50S ribosomal protein L25/general stress protein Ctc [Paenibacillus sabuli]
MANITLQVEEREAVTKGQLRQLRSQGKVPGVVYGSKIKETTALSIDEKQLAALLKSQPNAILDIKLKATGKQPVMIHDIQRDALSRQVMHIDLHQINMNEKITTTVRVETTGEAAGEQEGGILQLMLHELEVTCLPSDIPESVEVDVSALQIGENIQVQDLKLPKGVEAASEAHLVVATVLLPQKEEEEDAGEEGEEPELVGADGSESEDKAEDAEAGDKSES